MIIVMNFDVHQSKQTERDRFLSKRGFVFEFVDSFKSGRLLRVDGLGDEGSGAGGATDGRGGGEIVAIVRVD